MRLGPETSFPNVYRKKRVVRQDTKSLGKVTLFLYEYPFSFYTWCKNVFLFKSQKNKNSGQNIIPVVYEYISTYYNKYL